MVCDFDKTLEKMREEARKEKDLKRQEFLKRALPKLNNFNIVFELLALKLCRRYDIDASIEIPSCIYTILEDYIMNDNDEDIETYFNKNNSPLVRPVSELRKMFPELVGLCKDSHNNSELIKLANTIYGLNLQLDNWGWDAYVYSLEFDFNSFKPINLKEIREILTEINFCKKYNVDFKKLQEKLDSYGLTDEQLEKIMGV